MTNSRKHAVINFVTQDEKGEYKSYIHRYDVINQDELLIYINLENGINFTADEDILYFKNIAYQIGEKEAERLNETFIEGWLIEEKEIPDWYEHVIHEVTAILTYNDDDNDNYTENSYLQIAYIKDGLYIIFEYGYENKGMTLVKGYSMENAIENYFDNYDGILYSNIDYVDIDITDTIYKCVEE